MRIKSNFKDFYDRIQGYVTGFLSLEHKTIPEMSDKVKRDSHGFSRMSFKSRSND